MGCPLSPARPKYEHTHIKDTKKNMYTANGYFKMIVSAFRVGDVATTVGLVGLKPPLWIVGSPIFVGPFHNIQVLNNSWVCFKDKNACNNYRSNETIFCLR